MASGAEAELLELGVFRPQLVPVKRLVAGEVGYVATGLKNVREAQVGDTVTTVAKPATEPLPGYQEAKSLVFAGLYPLSGPDYPLLRDALEKLHLNDASFTYEPESSVALGFGFRCGFLGLLHMEIVQERLEREFNLDLIASAPSVEYRVQLTMGRGTVNVDNPAKFPDIGEIETIEEPWVNLGVVTPDRYIGSLMELTTGRRGSFVNMEYLDPQRVHMHFELPLAELIVDYYDQLKSRTQGYASMDYEETGYRRGEPRQARRPRQRRARRRPQPHRPPRPRAADRPSAHVEAPPADPAPDVRGAGAGGDRQPCGRPGDHQGDAQERAGEVLRWRYHPQAQAAREAERGQAAHEARGIGRDPAGGVPGDPAHGRGLMRRPVSRRLTPCRTWTSRNARYRRHPDPLRVLMAVGLAGILVILRFDAERFNAAEYDDVDKWGNKPSLVRRLAWYTLGIGGDPRDPVDPPDARQDLYLGLGDRLSAIMLGLAYGAIGTAIAIGIALYRYHTVRLPPVASYPGAILNAIATAFFDEAVFRGLLFGFLLTAGLQPNLANLIQALVYALATRLGAPGGRGTCS